MLRQPVEDAGRKCINQRTRGWMGKFAEFSCKHCSIGLPDLFISDNGILAVLVLSGSHSTAGLRECQLESPRLAPGSALANLHETCELLEADLATVPVRPELIVPDIC